MPYRWAMAMQQYSCMAPITLCGQRAVQGRESLTGTAVQSLRITDDAALMQPSPKCSSVIYNRPCLLALMESVSSPVVIVNGLEGLPHG